MLHINVRAQFKSTFSTQPVAPHADANWRRRPHLFMLMACWALLFLTGMVSAQDVQHTQDKADLSLRSNLRVDPSTLGMSISLPLGTLPGRGSSLPITLNYSSKLWRMKVLNAIENGTGHVKTQVYPEYSERTASGWTASISVPTIELTGNNALYDAVGKGVCQTCALQDPDQIYTYIARINVHMSDGSSHELRQDDLRHDYNSNTGVQWTGKFYSIDGSRLVFDFGANTLWMPDGSHYLFGPIQGSLDALRATQYTDSNGNTITYTAPTTGYPNGYWTDTLNRRIPIPVAAAAPSQVGDSIFTVAQTNIQYTLHWRYLVDPQSGASIIEPTDPDQQLRPRSQDSCSPTFYPTALFNTNSSTQVCGGTGSFNPVVLESVDLSDGLKYRFTYNIYGEIERVYLPTGGYEQFNYAQIPPLAFVTAPYSYTNRGVSDHYVSANGLGNDYMHWNYSVSTNPYKVRVTEPDNTYTERFLYPGSSGIATRFGFDDARTGMAYDESTYSGSGTMLRRTLTQWSETTESHTYNTTTVTSTRNPVVTKSVSMILDLNGGNALASTATTSYDNDLNPISTSHYDFVSIAATTATSVYSDTWLQSLPAGSLLRIDEATFLVNDASIDSAKRDSYRARNLIGLPTSNRVKNAAGTIVAQNSLSYDESGYLFNDYPNVPGWSDPGSVRGNVTSTGRWLDTSNTYLTTHRKYDQCGNLRSAWDAKGNLSQVEYDSAYSYAYPTRTITPPVPDPANPSGPPLTFTSISTYDAATGRVLSTTDANGKITTYEYAATDALNALNPAGRLTKVNWPDGGWTAYAYGMQPDNLFLMTRTAQDQTHNLDAYQYFDKLGRSTRAAQSEGSGSFVYSDTQYDLMGRVRQVSNPYRTGETVRWTSTAYDDLSRPFRVTTPDAAQVLTTYGISVSGTTLGPTVTAQDQSGKKRKSVTDALGRLTQVYEDPDGNNFLTSYAYDVLGNLRTVSQGVQTRSFLYDSLSRLASAFNPESGTIQYQYDANSNLILKIDPRPRPGNLTLSDCPVTYTGSQIATCYDYDALNRLKTRSYNDGTANVSYRYDTTTNGKGRLASVTSSVSMTSYDGYDQMGRVTANTQTTDGQSYTMAEYGYDLAGHLITETYPSGRVVSTAYDEAGRLASLTGQIAGAQTKIYAYSLTYWASGAVKDLRLGNALWQHTEFNTRLQPTEIDLGTQPNGIDRLKLAYSYETITGGQSNHDNNGNVLSQTITIPQIGAAQGFTATQTYGYDALNRLSSMTETGGLSQGYSYDRYGNRAVTAGYLASPTLTPQSLSAFDTNKNQITASSYDAAGNQSRDGAGRTFAYDAENHQSSFNATAALYSYDGEGRRVKKIDQSGTTIFVYDAMGQMVAEYSNATPSNADTDQTSYLTSDTLGTPRVMTGSSGQVKARHDYLPFGEELPTNVASGATIRTEGQSYVYGLGNGKDKLNQKFTGKERDGESGLDYFEARYYSSQQGRFTSPDEFTGGPDELYDFVNAASANPTFYADLGNPQSLNKYQYSYNNPLRYIDPDGHESDETNPDEQGQGTKSNPQPIPIPDGRYPTITKETGEQTVEAIKQLGSLINAPFDKIVTPARESSLGKTIRQAAGVEDEPVVPPLSLPPTQSQPLPPPPIIQAKEKTPVRNATRTPGGVTSGKSIKDKQAVERLRRGGDVISPSRAKAKELQKKASGGAVHDRPHGPGYRPHYHGKDRTGGHSFY